MCGRKLGTFFSHIITKFACSVVHLATVWFLILPSVCNYRRLTFGAKGQLCYLYPLHACLFY